MKSQMVSQGGFPHGEPGHVTIQEYYDTPVRYTTAQYLEHPQQGYKYSILGLDDFVESQHSLGSQTYSEDADHGYDLRTIKRKRSENGSNISTVDAPLSKRAMKRAQILEVHGSIGACDAPKGTTRTTLNGLEWWDPEYHVWRPAAPLDHYRWQFILEDNALGSYDIPPEHGEDAHDVTSFASAYGQQHWNVNVRLAWGNIRDNEGNEVLFLLEKPVREVDIQATGYMMHNGLIMLDPDDNPVRDWPGIPRCFSSQVEGGRLEALRRICGMTIPDLRARMPRMIKRKCGMTKPLYGLTALNQRLSRFRDKHGCPAWLTREKTGLKKHTLDQLAAQGSPLVSTAGLAPPSKYEIERRRLENRGKYPERAGCRAISAEERTKRVNKHKKRVQRLEVQEKMRKLLPKTHNSNDPLIQDGHALTSASLATTSTLKRERDDEFLDNIDSQLLGPPQKRGCTSSTASGSSSFIDLTSSGVDDGSCAFTDVPDFDFGSESDIINQTWSDDFNTFDLSNVGTEAPATPAPQDLRFLAPRNPAEQWSIKVALMTTLVDFQRYHGDAPTFDSDKKSYIEQYVEIQQRHEYRWVQPGAAPQLIGLTEWFGSFSQVPMPRLTEEFVARYMGHKLDASASSTSQSPFHTAEEYFQSSDNNQESEPETQLTHTQEQHIMGRIIDLQATTDHGSQDSADEEIARFEDPAMVEQSGPLADNQPLNVINTTGYETNWAESDPGTFPLFGDLLGGDGKPIFPLTEDYDGGVEQCHLAE